MARFFYHSFVRHVPADEVDRHIDVLENMLDMGFVLTPQVTCWREALDNGLESDRVKLVAKTVSFTQLHPTELMNHAAKYGPFALEFRADEFLRMGGLPVLYLPPLRQSSEGFDGVGAALLSRVGEIHELLQLIGSTHSLAAGDTLAVVTDQGSVDTGIPTDLIHDFVAVLEHRRGTEELLNALKTLLQLVFGADDGEVDTELAHYREREWRITSQLAKGDSRVSRELEELERARLLELNGEYFGELIQLPGKTGSRVNFCRLWTDLDGRSLDQCVNRVIVPAKAVRRVRDVLRKRQIDLDVAPLESLSGRAWKSRYHQIKTRR